MTNIKEQNEKMIQEVLEVYPASAKADRAKHLGTSDSSSCSSCITSNRKSQPGVMTARGCAYAGSKGVVFGPIKDAIHVSHGPIGCGQYSSAGRRNYYAGKTGVDSFGSMNFTSDFQEKDIVFGGDKKLAILVDELEILFPLSKGISIQSECPVGLIGDDIESVAKEAQAKTGKVVVPVRCEGFRGVSQSLGHHIANDAIRDKLIDNRENDDSFKGTPYDVALIGDYNISGDAWSTRLLLEEIGLRVISQWSGDGTFSEMELNSKAKINLVHCYRSVNYIARYMEEKYNIPWLEFNFFGPTKIAESLTEIASKFDETIQEKAKQVIAKYEAQWQAVVAKYKPRLEGKRVMLYVGGLRPRHIVGAYEDLGMEVVGTGYEFGHNDDYDRTNPDVKDSTLIYDDITGYEFEEFAKRLKPDLVGSGIKEKYIFQKMGIPFRQMHSWDYSGPYHAYDGFSIFARDMDMTLNNPCWSKMKAPWLADKKEDELESA